MPRAVPESQNTAPPCTVPGCGGVQLAHRLPDRRVVRWCDDCHTRLEHLQAVEGMRGMATKPAVQPPGQATQRRRVVATHYRDALPTTREQAVTAIEWAARAGVSPEKIRSFACNRRHRGWLAREAPAGRSYGLKYWRREEAHA